METTTAVETIRSIAEHPYAWPGGYVRALVMDDGEVLCPTCVRENLELILEATRDHLRDGWEAVGSFHAGETDDHHQTCAHCGAEMVTW